MTGMTNPQLYMAQVFTRCIDDQRELSEVVDLLLRSFRLLWSRKSLRNAERAVGFVEVVLSDFGDEWNVHMHLVMDAPAVSVTTDLVNRAWRRLIHPRRGQFSTDGKARSPEAIASYITKDTSYSPHDGHLSKAALETLLLALHRRRLPIIRRSRRARSEQRRTVDRSEIPAGMQ
jgi:hypothetical protein